MKDPVRVLLEKHAARRVDGEGQWYPSMGEQARKLLLTLGQR